MASAVGMRYLKDVVTLQLDTETCNGCGICVDVCPHEVFEIVEKKEKKEKKERKEKKARIIDRDACMECGACALNCSVGSLTVQAGVGCAAAVINGALGGTEACCCG